MDRETRRLLHHKGNKMKVSSSAPLPNDGDDGDMILRTTGLGAILYVKGQNRWWKFQPHESKDDGWHGSTQKIRLVSSDFTAGAAVTAGNIVTAATAGYVGVNNASAINQLVATVSVPIGYIPTAVKLYHVSSGTSDPFSITVYQQLMTEAGSGTTILSGTAVGDNEIALTGTSKSTDVNFVRVLLTGFHGDSEGTTQHFLRGGYIRIAPVITAQESAQRAVDEDVLGRGT